MRYKRLIVIGAAALAAAGCSTKPLSTATTDTTAASTATTISANTVPQTPIPPTTTTTTPPTTTTTAEALPTLDVPNLNLPYDGIKPVYIAFSPDGTNIVTNMSWTSWTATSATGTGAWTFEDCNPSCDGGSHTPYSATITLSNPQGGIFTTITETQSGPDGQTITFTYPSEWPMYASNTMPG
jgi:hypothetical protein